MADNNQVDDWEDVTDEVDDWEDVTDQAPGGYEGFAQKTLGVMRDVGPAVLGGYEKYVSAPIRSAVGATMDKPTEPFAGVRAAYGQFGEDPTKAPTGSQLLEKAGVNVPSFNLPTPFQKDLEGNKYQINTRDVAGGVVGAALDPLSYVPVGRMLPGKQAAAKALGEFAEERAAKQAMGSGLANVRRAAGITPRGATNIEQAQGEIRKLGRTALDEGMIGPFSTTESIGKKASKEFPKIQDEFSVVQNLVDQTVPQGAVSGKAIAEKIVDYAAQLPETETKKALQDRLLREAMNFEKRPNMTFAEAQLFKNDFKYKDTDPDAFVSNQDAINTIKRIIGDEMKTGTDFAEKRAMESGNADAAKKIALYRNLLNKYGAYKDITTAATDRWARDFSNNFLSPLNTVTGGAFGAGALSAGSDVTTAGLTSAGVIGAMQLGRSRGGAFAARTADALSKVLSANPQKFGKWTNRLISAAGRSPNAFVVTHQLLMQNDPEYRQAFTSEISQGEQP